MTVTGRDEMAAGLRQLLETLWISRGLNSEAQTKDLMQPRKIKHTLRRNVAKNVNRKRCSHKGCTSFAQKGGMCKGHKAFCVSSKGICGYPECTKEVYKRGKCAEHDLCNHPECTKRVLVRGKCRMHGV